MQKKLLMGMAAITIVCLSVWGGWWLRGRVSPGAVGSSEKTGSTAADYPLLDPMRAAGDQADFVVVFRPLRLKIEELVAEWAEKGVVVAVQIEYLNTGTHVSVNQNYRMLPASLTKVPVAMMIMEKVEKGQLSMTQKLTVTEADRDGKWGELYKAPEGTELTLEEVVKLSLIESDNTAHKMLYRLVGIDEAQELSAELNLEDLFDAEGKITAREYARLLRALYTSSYLDRENSQKLLSWMSGDQVVKFLSRGIAPGVPYAHKFGENSQAKSYLDAGIVYATNRPYIIVVMIKDIEGKIDLSRNRAGEEIFLPIAQMTYKYVTSR